MMDKGVSTLAVLLILLSGCAVHHRDAGTPVADRWIPDTCSTGVGPSANAPLAPLLRGGNRTVVTRLAAALGDSITSPTSEDWQRHNTSFQPADSDTYASEQGTWTVYPNGGVVFDGRAARTEETEPITANRLEDALFALGFKPDAVVRPAQTQDVVSFEQWYEGQPVATVIFERYTNQYDSHFVQERVAITFDALRSLGAATARVDSQQARQTADAYLACLDALPDAVQSSHAYNSTRFGVWYDSLVHAVAFDGPARELGTTCPQIRATVVVDAQTNTALGIDYVCI